MADYLYRFFSGVTGYYRSMNAAYLSGAIDVLVVEQPDGTFRGSPFHVRFGKSASFLPRQLHVDIYVNDQPTELRMKLGPNGEAFFVRELPHTAPETPPPPPALVTSPIQSDDEDFDDEKLATGPVGPDVEASSPAKLQPPLRMLRAASLPVLLHPHEAEEAAVAAAAAANHEALILTLKNESLISSEGGNAFATTPKLPVSEAATTDTLTVPASEQRLIQCLSDTDISASSAEAAGQQPAEAEPVEWPWGQFPRPMEPQDSVAPDALSSSSSTSQPTSSASSSTTAKLSSAAADGLAAASIVAASAQQPQSQPPGNKASQEGGVYLSDLDPQLSSLYLYAPTPRAASPASEDVGYRSSDDNAAGASAAGVNEVHNAARLSQGGGRRPPQLDNLSLSLCGPLKPEEQQLQEVTIDRWARNLVTYEEFIRDPDSVLTSPHLVVQLDGRYSNWRVAAPQILSLVAFGTPLPERTMEQLRKKHQPTKSSTSGASIGVGGGAGGTTSGSGRRRRGWGFLWKSSSSNVSTTPATNNPTTLATNSEATIAPAATPVIPVAATKSTNNDLQQQQQPESQPPHHHHSDSNVYVKSVRLTSEEIARLDLQPGANRVEFSVTTAFQGTTKCFACIYRVSHSDRLVISDVDGTITRSDVLGHLLPMLGRSWSHEGVTKLFRSIRDNGYHLLYLSSRGIGMSAVTRQFIDWVNQEDVALPDGPIMLNPTSLVTAFRKEVIEKCPEKFKIACLSDIRSLFPDGNPFYAGFGNRDTDALAYATVGVPPQRIFIINPRSQVSHRHSLVQSTSYRELSAHVDLYFPCRPGFEHAHQQHDHYEQQQQQQRRRQHHRSRRHSDGESEFSDFAYWRQPAPPVPPPPPPPPSQPSGPMSPAAVPAVGKVVPAGTPAASPIAATTAASAVSTPAVDPVVKAPLSERKA